MEWILTRPAGPPPPSGASTSSARARGAYLIVGVTRIVADRVLGDSIRGAHLIAFTLWALDEGARSASKLGFAPLPLDVVRQQQQRLDALRPGTCPRPTATP